MRRRAHRPDEPTRRQVEAMAAYGVPATEIAGVIGLDPKVLAKHYRHELDHGHTKANARVAENLYRKATGEGREAVTAAIFWLKTRAGWKETIVQETTAEIRYVARLPEPVADIDEWLRLYAPKTIDHQPQPQVDFHLPGKTNGEC